MTPEQRTDVDTALFAYWTSRSDAAAAQQAKGVRDVGGRAGATSGGHLDRVAQLLAKVAVQAGAPSSAVYYKTPVGDENARPNMASGFTLPGFFRPTKQWDVVTWGPDETPVAVIELKSQNGPSYGNNANNRAEEAIGNAVDFRRAAVGDGIPGNPWLGYVFVIEDDAFSRSSRQRGVSGKLESDPVFDGWSYVKRVQLLSERLVSEGLYHSVWAVASTRPACPGSRACPWLLPTHNALASARKRNERADTPVEMALSDALVAELAAELAAIESSPEHVHTFGWSEPDPDTSGYVQFTAGLGSRIREAYRQSMAG